MALGLLRCSYKCAHFNSCLTSCAWWIFFKEQLFCLALRELFQVWGSKFGAADVAKFLKDSPHPLPFPSPKSLDCESPWGLSTFGMVWGQRQLRKPLSWVSSDNSIIPFCKEERWQHRQEKVYFCSLAQLAKVDRPNIKIFQHSSADRASFFFVGKLLNKDSVKQIIVILKEIVIIAFQDCARKWVD